MKLKVIATALAVMLALPVSIAQAKDANPVKERQKQMRSVGKAMKTTVKMMRGELAYDGARVMAMMKTMNEVSGSFTGLFPKGSDKENSIMDFDKESSALPAIWESMDDFKGKAETLKTASAAAMKVAGDKAAFGAAFGAVGKTCKSCHSKYKAKDE